MKQENDVQLISKILGGDDTAFSTLVEKYQKGIHALVWRKIGDFHYAEEITQDTFLSAYKNISTLKEPSQFAGWLYVIANRLCINWNQRNKSKMQSLASTPMEKIERSSYNHYMLEQREAEATERRHRLVKNLLEKLPESGTHGDDALLSRWNEVQGNRQIFGCVSTHSYESTSSCEKAFSTGRGAPGPGSSRRCAYINGFDAEHHAASR